MFKYRAQITNVVDGDTLDVEIDLGFGLRKEVRLRLLGVDTAEVYGVSKDSDLYKTGKRHSAFVQSWVESGEKVDDSFPFIVKTEKRGKFGRYLATVHRSDGAVLNDDLLETFDGVAY